MESHPDEPLTPAGRLFLQPHMNTIIHCVVGFERPIDVPKSKDAVMSSIMVRHPRFRSVLVRDKRGFEHWRETGVDIDQHFVEVHDSTSVNDYVAGLSFSSPLSEDKPLWEVHVLAEHRCGVFRIHHALGDGISLVSMLLAGCRLADDPEALPAVAGGKRTESAGRIGSLWGLLKMVLLSIVFVFEFVLRALWVSDRKTAISGGAGVELWPRKLATATFSIDDMKAVKNALAGVVS